MELSNERCKTIASSMIKKYVTNSFLRKKFLEDGQYLGKVMSYIFHAHDSYDESKVSNPGNASIEGRMCRYARYAIYHLLQSEKRQKNRNHCSLEQLHEAKKIEPEVRATNEDNIRYSELTGLLTSGKYFSKKDGEIFIEYAMNNVTLEELGNKYNMTRAGVHYIINNVKKQLVENL